jgi:hypothetical protein
MGEGRIGSFTQPIEHEAELKLQGKLHRTGVGGLCPWPPEPRTSAVRSSERAGPPRLPPSPRRRR